jgi:hypothetical protein
MTIRELYFASSVVCMVIAGFTLVLTAMWLMAYFSSPKQTGSVRAICFSGVATLAFAFAALWLLLRAGIAFL